MVKMEQTQLLSWQIPIESGEAAELEKLAEQGDSRAQTEYGKCLLFGKGGRVDGASAFKWLEKAAQQSSEIAKMYIGHCYLYGIGVEKNESKGYVMLNDALNYNYPDEGSSQPLAGYSTFQEEDLCQLFWDLGDALENSLGVIKNYRVAVYYFNMLAEWGHPEGAERKSKFKRVFGFWKKVD